MKVNVSRFSFGEKKILYKSSLKIHILGGINGFFYESYRNIIFEFLFLKTDKTLIFSTESLEFWRDSRVLEVLWIEVSYNNYYNLRKPKFCEKTYHLFLLARRGAAVPFAARYQWSWVGP